MSRLDTRGAAPHRPAGAVRHPRTPPTRSVPARPDASTKPSKSDKPNKSNPTAATASDAPAPRARTRRDIQGLRAVAVLTVVAEHYGVPWLRGGYVGVDVFLVISGYLISGLLLREVAGTGRISLRDFYARRARRILPAATLVVVLTTAAAALLVSATTTLRLVTDAVWAALFAANVRFAAIGTDYNQQGLATSPLQHYWSLAVEEQFYLAWPLILLACVFLARRLGRRVGHVVVPVLGALTVASFVLATVRASADPTATYFSTGARVWELGVGAAVALLAAPGSRLLRRLPDRARSPLAAVGLAAIVAACVGFGPTSQSHAPLLLLPVLGAALILLAGAARTGTDAEAEALERTWAARVLGVRPLRAVGDWSYSLYLWHWPLLILALDRLPEGGRLDGWARGSLALAALALAALTYRWVETPLRDRRRLPRPRALALYPVSVAAVCLTCALASLWGHYRAGEFGDDPPITASDFALGVTSGAGTDVVPHQSSDPTIALVQASVVAAEHHLPVPSQLDPPVTDLVGDVPDLGACDYNITGNRNLCPRGDVTADRTLVVLGNSHGRMWIPAIETIAEREHYKAYYLTKPNCSAADLSFTDVDPATPVAPWTDCSDFRVWALQQIAALHPALTIVSTSGPNSTLFPDGGGEVDQDTAQGERLTGLGFAKLYAELEPDTDRLVLLRDVPKPGTDPGTCLTTDGHDLGDCLFRPAQPAERDARASVAQARAAGIDVINPFPWFCWRGTCPMVVGDTITYRDLGHITSAYATALTEPLGRALGIWTD